MRINNKNVKKLILDKHEIQALESSVIRTEDLTFLTIQLQNDTTTLVSVLHYVSRLFKNIFTAKNRIDRNHLLPEMSNFKLATIAVQEKNMF